MNLSPLALITDIGAVVKYTPIALDALTHFKALLKAGQTPAQMDIEIKALLKDAYSTDPSLDHFVPESEVDAIVDKLFTAISPPAKTSNPVASVAAVASEVSTAAAAVASVLPEGTAVTDVQEVSTAATDVAEVATDITNSEGTAAPEGSAAAPDTSTAAQESDANI
jgi:hypothetical protein